MKLPKLEDLDVEGKKVLVRADLDLGTEEKDNFRLEALLPTLKFLIDKKAKMVVIGHRGRPGGKEDSELSLEPVSKLLEEMVKKYSPEAVAVETLFFNTNQKTAMNVAHVRGMIIYLTERLGLHLFEYTPLQIKVAITGYGRSDKNQITAMMPNLIGIDKEIKIDDEWDAIAVGLTCFATEKF